tara:strand:- start:300 stop:1088 length:789 start_codon:yes stop_codon:yes gene_type:complete
MAIITLTTDLGIRDNYVASLKASILTQNEEVNIIDISHNIESFNINQATHVLKTCFKNFPNNTVHIITVDDELNSKNEHLLAFYNQQYFLCADNGFFNLFFDVFRPDKLFQITVDQKSDILTFASREILSIAACHLCRGGTPEIIGKEISNYTFDSTSIKPVIDKNSIRCTVIYIDNYGNVVTNIQKQLFQTTVGDKQFKIFHGYDTDSINKISQVYNDVSIAEKLAIFDMNDYLQIAINKGNASSLLGLKVFDIIRIEISL